MANASQLIQRIAFWALIVGSIILLAFTAETMYQRTQKQDQLTETKPNDVQYKTIDATPESITNGLKLYQGESSTSEYDMARADYLALFILNSKVCVPCITEVHEFIDICTTNKVNSITSWVLLAESDTTNVARFLQASEFHVPTFYGFTPMVDSLLTFVDGNRISQMMAILDLSKGAVIYRTGLSSRITSPEYKLSRLQEAGLVTR